MTISALRAVAGGIPNPSDYFLGVDPYPSRSPTSVLQFLRRDDSHLDPCHGPAVHHRFVLIANLETSGYVILDGSTIPLHEGDGLLIFPFQSHYYARISGKRSASWLFTTFEYENPNELESLRDASFRLEGHDVSRLSRITSLLKAQETVKSSGGAAPFELALLLGGLLQRRKSYLSSTGGIPDSELPDIDFLQRTTLFIHRNLHRPITTEEIAREASLSASRLRSKFREITGISLGKYIRQSRIHKARALLHNTGLSVTQISQSCGFDSLFSFSRAFRAATGKAPSHFRKSLKKQKHRFLG